MYGSLVCAQQGKGATAEEGVVLWNYSYSLSAERESFGQALRQPRVENACTENTPTHTLRSAVTIPGPSAVTPASAPARTAVRNPPRQKPSQVARRCERTVPDAAAGRKHGRRRGTCEFVCMTHLVGVLRVELCLHVLFLLLPGPGCLAAAAGDSPPLPLSACTHYSLSI